MKTTRMRALFCLLLATTAIGGGAAAYSQARDPMWDSSRGGSSFTTETNRERTQHALDQSRQPA